METTISSKFQIVIPKAIRERLRLQPQQRLTIIEKGGVMHLIPAQSLDQLRGIASGVKVEKYRDKSDRF